jgi:hypothetical protein
VIPDTSFQRGVLLLFTASSFSACAAQAPQPAPPRAAMQGGGPSARAEPGEHSAPAAHTALPPKRCASRAASPTLPVSWVEDARQKLCCAPRGEGGAWLFVEPESCVSRYAPWLRLPEFVEANAGATGSEQPLAGACSPGVEARVLIPTPEFEAQLDSGSLLRVESCLGESCAAAVVAFDSLSRDDQLLFALEGTPTSGANLLWRAGAVRLSIRVVQSRERVVQVERYRLTLTLDGKPLRAIDTTLAYSAPRSADCPLAHVTIASGEDERDDVLRAPVEK